MSLSQVFRTIVLAAALAAETRGELPLARLQSILPAGGQAGTTVQVTFEGVDLDDASAVHFSTAGITPERTPTNAPGVFAIKIASDVSPGVCEARVIGRFGI